MSIESNASSQPPPVKATDRAGNDKQDTRAREPVPREKIDKFERLMQDRQARGDKPPAPAARQGENAAAQQAGEEVIAGRPAVAERGEDDALLRHRDETASTPANSQPIDASALYQAQMAMRDGMPPPTAPTPLNPNAFADMVERHLKQLAADRGNAGGDGRVLLRMADATLPGTDLLLSRTADGWLLRADVRSRSSFDAIRQAAPALARRFAERNLGTLSIDPHFHG